VGRREPSPPQCQCHIYQRRLYSSTISADFTTRLRNKLRWLHPTNNLSAISRKILIPYSFFHLHVIPAKSHTSHASLMYFQLTQAGASISHISSFCLLHTIRMTATENCIVTTPEPKMLKNALVAGDLPRNLLLELNYSIPQTSGF